MVPLTLELVDFLLSDRAGAALETLARADLGVHALLGRLMELRREFTATEAAVLLDQARLRQSAAGKFPDAGRLFFTEEALQQASSPAVARYRAQRFGTYTCVADLGCGIGSDTLALAEVVAQVIAVERNPVRARLAAANIAARGLTHKAHVLCTDWTQARLAVNAAFADPSRRQNGRRVFGLARMEPPIAAILVLQSRIPDVGVKVAPGVSHEEIPEGAEVEFISEKGALKEALLLFGGLRSGTRYRATLLPGPFHLEPGRATGAVSPREPGAFLYEPDPAVLRAGLVRTLGAQLGAQQIDATIAYLTGDALTATPFARAWSVIRHGPFGLKTLNRWLREAGAGQVVVKKRGSPIDPDAFRRRLKTVPGGAAVTVFLTRVRGRPWMMLANEVSRR
jgi:hypothetical protein